MIIKKSVKNVYKAFMTPFIYRLSGPPQDHFLSVNIAFEYIQT